MPIYRGDTEVLTGQLKLGNTDVKEVYLGTEKIWPPKPKNIVIYEHNVSPIPTVSTASGLIDFGNGYKLYWVCGWTHNSALEDPVYGLKLTSNFADKNDKMAVVYVIGTSMPITYNGSTVTPLVYVDDPNFPDGHKELFDTKQVKGFKITVHRWHDMSRKAGAVEIYNRRTNWTGNIDQRYDSGTQTGGKADGIVNTPIGELNIGNENTAPIPGNYLTNWNYSPFKAFYGPMDPNTNKPSGQKGQGWFWAIKKVELVL